VGLTYLPIPGGPGGNYAGLLTLELPPGSAAGARYRAVVRQLSNFGTPGEAAVAADLSTAQPTPAAGDRRIRDLGPDRFR